MSDDVKVYVPCHRPLPVWDAPHFVPLHVGRSEWDDEMGRAMPNCLGDDSGNSISKYNRYYSELTGHYWVWRNIPADERPDIVGFFQYRRYLDLRNTAPFTPGIVGATRENAVHFGWEVDDIADLMHTTDMIGHRVAMPKEGVRQLAAMYDLMTPERTTLYESLPEFLNLYDNYQLCHRREDLDLAIAVTAEMYPEYRDAICQAMNSREAFFLNMYVTRWPIFDAYSSWLFPILGRVRVRILDRDGQMPTGYQRRVLGFLAERLFNVFIAGYRDERGNPLRVTARPVVFVADQAPCEEKVAAAHAI